MKVQEIYKKALLIIGKTEEGTNYPFMDRVPSLLNPDIATLNLFRDSDKQLSEVSKMSDELDLTAKEANGLAYCLAYIAATEGSSKSFSDARLALLYKQRNAIMGSITTGLQNITETIGMS